MSGDIGPASLLAWLARLNARVVLGSIATVLLALTILVLLTSANTYTLHADFADAGQLVTGGEVQIAGRPVGTISNLSLTPNGLAEVTMSIDDADLAPLHYGTRAIIRAVGQAGVDNRFIQLIPGASSAPMMRSGATLPLSQTTGIVDLDEVLDTFDPKTRAAVQQLIANSSQVFAGSGSHYFNSMLSQLDPALDALDGVTSQVAEDNLALGQLVRSGATAAAAVAGRSTDLQNAVSNAASTFAAVASERSQLADLLTRAPAVLTEAGSTLHQTADAVDALRPDLRAIVPVAGPLRRLLTILPPTLHRATPVVGELTTELPSLRTALARLAPLAGPAVRALESTGTAFKLAMPILVGLREYGSDLVLGLFNGLGGLVSGPYTSQGHYAKLNFVQSLQTLAAGLGSQLLTKSALVPGVLDVRTKVYARCPGGDAPPAPDGSNPWIPQQDLCDPADDVPLSVDFP
jgi:phospholipid/cholesterol/gamma-HCH transport system substrate-binding protein